MKVKTSRNATYAFALPFVVNLLNFFDSAAPAVGLEPIRIAYKLDDTSLAPPMRSARS